jgi:ABC-type nitrate/sulfonate/bicarbonate transport system ATPase subunit
MTIQPYELKETILQVQHVSLTLGNTQILRDVNVEVKNIVRPGMNQGQVIGFLGKSGSGKTKLFEILAGLLKPTSGEVRINGNLEPVKVGSVGVVQQNYPLFQHRTLYSNLEVAAAKSALTPAEQKDKIHYYMEHFNLLEHVNFYPCQLSGGQRQRVAIAQQLLCSEHFLLLDEPFSGLDIVMIRQVQEMIGEISTMDELNTVIIVSHDIESTASISDTLWLLGRDQDPQTKHPIPGSRIKYNYNLVEKGLAWQKDIEATPEFHEFITEVKEAFQHL